MKNMNKSTYVMPQMELEIFTSMDVISTSFAGDDEANKGILQTGDNNVGWSRRWGSGERSVNIE